MYNYKDFLNETRAGSWRERDDFADINKICKIITTKTDYKLGDDKLMRGDNRVENYITDLPRERISSTGSNKPMRWIDQSPRWKDFPKRGNSLTFLKNDIAQFGECSYRLLPFKDVKIAHSSNGDFNYSFINEYLEEVFESLYNVGLNDHYGDGYSPGDMLNELFFKDQVDLNNDFKLACNEIEKKIMNTEFVSTKSGLFSASFKMNAKNIPKYKYEFQRDVDLIKKSYFKWLGTHYENYYGFVDFLLDPKLNGFRVITYKEAVQLGNSVADELWIDGESIMILDSHSIDSTVATKVFNKLKDQQLKSKRARS